MVDCPNLKALSTGLLFAIVLLYSFAELKAEESNPATAVADEALLAEPEAEQGFVGMEEAIGPEIIPEEDFAKLPTAVQWHYELAQQGDREAQYNLGSLYETGFGIAVDPKKAIFWLTKAADQGHIHAQLKLGLMTILGIGTEASLIKGRKWILAAADKDNKLAKMLIEKVLSHEAKSLVNVDALTKKVYIAFGTGEFNAEETLRIAIQRVERDRKEEPEKERFSGVLTGSGAKQGSVKNRLPDFLDKDSVDRSTLGRSASLVRRHAKEGAADAQYELAHMLEFGQGILMDKTEATKWYAAASAQGYADAQYRLGLAYLYGLGVARDKNKAALWLKRASEQHHPAASLIRSQVGDQQGLQGLDVSMALSIYLERSLKGDGPAMIALGHMFENGWGVQPDEAKAQRWYAKARAAGALGATGGQIKRAMTTSGAGQPGQMPASESQNTDPRAPASPGNIDRAAESAMTLATEGVPVTGISSVAVQRQQTASLSMQDRPQDLQSTAGVKLLFERYGMPALLLLLGLLMGWLVFRLMRRGGSQEAA